MSESQAVKTLKRLLLRANIVTLMSNNRPLVMIETTKTVDAVTIGEALACLARKHGDA